MTGRFRRVDDRSGTFVVRPSTARVLGWHALQLAVILACGHVLFLGQPPPVSLSLVGAVVGLIAGGFQLRRLDLELNDGVLYGPAWSGRASVRVAELDAQGSTTVFSLLQLGTVWSIADRGGPRLAIPRQAYAPEDLDSLAALLGLPR